MATVTAPSDQARAAFADAFGYPSLGVAWAPGRVNLIGEHTDYNDGFVLPMAIERGVSAAFAPRTDLRLRAHAPAFDETREAAIAALTPEGDDPRDPRGHWFAYVAGMVWAMRRAGVPVGGLDLAIASDLPIGAGLSSSAALEMAVARAACAAASIAWNAGSMARLGQQAENEFVGVSCGIMDQLASAACEDGHALLVDCRSLETRLVPIPAEASFVVMDTGMRRALAGSEYNDRRAACERAVAAVRTIAAIATIAPGVHALRDVDAALLERARGAMDEVDYRRALHVVHEIRRPLEMADALNAGDLADAGRLMNASHESLRDLYDVSSPELDTMVAIARGHAACFGARLTGAGFGGCAVALVASSAVEDFRRHVETGYREETGCEARTFSSRPAGGAHLVE